MLNLKNQPFLLSLQQELGQTGDLESFKTLLREQQNSFKEYLHPQRTTPVKVHL